MVIISRGLTSIVLLIAATGQHLAAGLNSATTHHYPVVQQQSDLAAQNPTAGPPFARCYAPGTGRDVIEHHQKAIPFDAFRINETFPRWTSTATDGSGIPRGVPITVRYSFLPDGVAIGGFNGEPAAPSNLIAFLNGLYGSPAVWLPLFQQAFNRWSELSGITCVYEPNDDGAIFPDSPGVVGVRGDIRIGGHYIDGNFGVLAYNFYPTTGDMVIDTADNFFNTTSNGSLRLRNVVAHEVGHGLGFMHVCPVDETKLMERFASTSFDGPQHDDILAAQRNYGDRFGAITNAATAHNLGLLTNQTITLTNASIDGLGEVDFFRFTVPDSNRRATVLLTPVGRTYLEGVQNPDGSCTAGSAFNSTTINDLGIEVRDSNGTTVLASANANPAGQSETLTNVLLASGSGPFYIRVFGGAVDNVQSYSLAVTISDAPSLAAPIIAAEPAITAGTQNTISWSAVAPAGTLASAPQWPKAVAVKGGDDSEGEIAVTLAGGGDVEDNDDSTLQPIQLQLPSSGRISAEIDSKPDAPAPVWQGLFNETFEGAFPGASWTLYGSPTWNDTSYSAHAGSWSGWCAGSVFSPSGGYVDNMQAWMVYGPFNLANATGARVNFWYKNYSEQNFDYFAWLYSTNGVDFNGVQVSGNQNSWRSQIFDLAAATGQAQVWIAFLFESDDSVSGTSGYTGAFVDDIVIEKDVPSDPDLTPYQPPLWNNKIPISTTQLQINDPHTYSGAFNDNQILYFNWASFNQGNSAAGSYTVRVEVTGSGGGTWNWTVPNHPTNGWYASAIDQPVGPLAAGNHTFKLWLDYSNAVTEVVETNNYYERTITVVTPLPVEYFAECATNAAFSSAVNSGWILPTQHTFTGLTRGKTYWYRVKARQGSLQSPWSNSVNSQQQASIPPEFIQPQITAGNFKFTLNGEAGRTYILQYSSNLVSWTTLTTVTNVSGSVIYTDPGVATVPRRFYRSFPEE